MRKSNGETLREAVIPPHPAQSTGTMASAKHNRPCILLNFINREIISVNGLFATPICPETKYRPRL